MLKEFLLILKYIKKIEMTFMTHFKNKFIIYYYILLYKV